MIEQHATLAEKFLKKGIWLYLFSFLIGPIWYVIKIIVSNELTVNEIWILYGVISLVTMIWAYNDLWMTESLKHFIPRFITEKRYDKIQNILCYAFLIQFITGFIIAWILFFWSNYIANVYFQSPEAIYILKVFSIFFIGINIFQILHTFFISIQNTFFSKWIEFIRILFVMISVIIIFISDASSLGNYSISWIVWLYLGVFITIILFYKKYYSKYLQHEKLYFDTQLFWEVAKYALYVFIWAGAWVILSQIDMQMIIYILGTEDAGYYTNYLSIIGIPFIIIGPILGFLFPVFSEMYSKREFHKIKMVKEIFVKNFILIWIMFNIFFFIFAKYIAYTLFWEKFIPSWMILQYSILFLVFLFLFQINFNILAGTWQVKKRVQITLCAILFNFIMNIILIKQIWVNWAALATWLWWIFIYLSSEIFLGKQYRISFDSINILKNIILMWWLWYIIHVYIEHLFLWASRAISFFIISACFVLWSIIFIIINYKQSIYFVREIQNIYKPQKKRNWKLK